VAAENARTGDSDDLRLILYAEIRFGATTKMGRTTWNPSIAVPVQLRIAEQAAQDCRKRKTSVETENGNHRKRRPSFGKRSLITTLVQWPRRSSLSRKAVPTCSS
jgi:hypothetical protein